MREPIMSDEEKDELRTNAPIPIGMNDYRDCQFKNKHNGVEISVVGYEVTDSGVILWKTDGNPTWNSQTNLELHWDVIGGFPKRVGDVE